MAEKENHFITHIREGMSRFGMSMESSEDIGDNLSRLILKDNAHKTGYVAIARRTNAKNPDKFWGDVIDSQLKNALQESAYKGEALPAALIVPSEEADAVIAQSAKRDIKPSVYQLFDGYVVIGYRRKDSQILLKGKENAQQTETSPEPPKYAELEPAAAESQKIKVTLKTIAERDKSSGINPKKLAAAALLGVTIASIPFAVNKFKDNFQEFEEAAENPMVKNVLTNANEGREGSQEIQAALAANAPLPDYHLEKLISDGYLRDVAQNPNISRDLLLRFSSDPDPLVRAAAARNRSIPEEVLHRMASDRSSAVRASAASNPNLPPELLDKLSLDSDRTVCSAVLENPNLTPFLLDHLEPNINQATCANKEKIFAGPCVSPAALSYNANNPDSCIRRGIAKNPRTDKDVLRELYNDTDRAVRDGVLANPSIDKKELLSIFPRSWGGIGEEESYSPEKTKDIQAALRNNATPEFILNNALADNPGKYGAAAAHSPLLSERNIAFLYDYSIPRGGMDGFFAAVNALQNDRTILDMMKSGKTGMMPDNRSSLLRRRINRLFADNLYNPVAALRMIVSSSSTQAGLNADGETAMSNRGNSHINMRETGEGDAFFDDVSILTLDDKEFDRFSEFFEDLPSLSNRGKALLETADLIVDAVMDELLPVMEKVMEKDADISSPISDGGRSIIPAAGERLDSSINGANKTPSGTISAQRAETRAASPVLSDALYGNSCRQIESLLHLF